MSDDNPFDTIEETGFEVDTTEVGDIATLAQEMREAEAEVIERTAALQAAVRRLSELRDVSLPKALEQAGVSSITLTDGTPLATRTRYDGRKLTEPAGLAWVQEHGGAPIIKTVITVELERGALEDAKQLMIELREHRFSNQFRTLTLEEHVVAQTIGKFAREKVEAGSEPPLDLLGVHRRTYAVLGKTQPKSVDVKGLLR